MSFAVAAPMPRDAPEIKATLPSKRFMAVSIVCNHQATANWSALGRKDTGFYVRV
jgi:hypothetical protein